MDKIPQSAAVNECVSLAKQYCKGQKNAPGLVNAVLHNAIRQKESLTEPKSYVERYSHPQKLVDRSPAHPAAGAAAGAALAGSSFFTSSTGSA